jgi:hypothetical protein
MHESPWTNVAPGKLLGNPSVALARFCARMAGAWAGASMRSIGACELLGLADVMSGVRDRIVRRQG